MSNLWKYLLASPILCGTMLVAGGSAFAEETPTTSEINEPAIVASTETKAENSYQEKVMAQVTSVSQLSDVQPTDWAFQALQSLVERYGCIAGYPNSTYRGNRALTRYEFAAGLNACLDRVNELLATATGDLVTKEDLARVQQLQEQFSAELATLRGRVDALETTTAELEANQFSTTTKLQGQIVAVVSDVLSGDEVNGSEITEKNTTLGARARIEFVTSFTGQDTLFTRIQTNNIPSPDINTREGSLFFAGGDSNEAAIDALWYAFPLTRATQVKLIANAGAADDLTSTVNIFDGDGAFGALSTFGTRNPIYNQIGGSGLGITQYFSENLSLSLGYLAGTANNPQPKNGLFDGAYGALAQLTFQPTQGLTLGLTYINSYNTELNAGSNRANLRSVLLENFGEELDTPVSSNSYGLQASFQLSPKFVIGGWVGYTNTRTLVEVSDLGIPRGELDIWNYAVTLAFPDLGKKGSLGGIIVGMEPKVTAVSNGLRNAIGKDPDTSFHIEGFYQYKLSDNITITPGVIWLTAPNHNENNDSVVIGALRTTFSF